uniref:Frag1/DRAM/Sfk1 family protein n=1 Tax=Candidatus Kentrum sp. FW TaxID=2126338 RepID=A0A450SZT8_9GAMM|nr:MAG: Frag1/DRAM/Sfk1 family protein [Candidatus Kentron sp. FW]VFJ64862.1 MAG: Frag1/DRAM/Sfk1 family protein [Candidatus Kentron sp. FW]
MQRVFNSAGPLSTACPLLVFVFGVISVVATAVAFWFLDPDYFATGLPTISHMADHGLPYLIFTTGMVPTVICILRSVYLVATTHKKAIAYFARDAFQRGHWRMSIYIAWVFGILFGLSLGGLTLFDSGSTHVHFTLAFFITLVLAFLFDTLLARSLGKTARGEYPPGTGFWIQVRSWFIGILFMCGIFMAIFYYGQEFLPGWLYPQADNIYSLLEYMFAFLAFGYSGAYFWDMQKARARLSENPS